jgi:hypothetical protein
MKLEKQREHRKEVVALCDLLNGTMFEDTDQFELGNCDIDLSATNTDCLYKAVVNQVYTQAVVLGQEMKSKIIKDALGL